MGYFRDNIDKADGYTPGFQPKDADIIKLNTNENPYPPCPEALEALQQITLEQLRKYPDPTGNLFRQTAAKVVGIETDNIICTNGGDDLLTIAIRAFCDKGRALAYPTPTYSLYPVLGNLQNCPVIEIPFASDFGLPTGLFNSKAALTIVCNPNAPTGTIIGKDKIAELADAINGVLLVDEAYVDFASDNCVSLIKDFDNIIILRSLSKGYSLAGMRFGYGIASKNIIAGLMKVKDSYNIDAVSIAVATAAISNQDYFKSIVEKIKSQRQVLTAELRKLGFEVNDSQSNFVLAKWLAGDAGDIFEKLIEQNIFVRYWKTDGLADKLRITVGTEEQNQMLINTLKNILK